MRVRSVSREEVWASVPIGGGGSRTDWGSGALRRRLVGRWRRGALLFLVLRRTPGHQGNQGAHAAANCRGSGKRHNPRCAGHGQHKRARVSYPPRMAWATAIEQTPDCRDGPDIAADGQKRHDGQHAWRRRQQQHRPDLLNRQTRSGSPRSPHLEPHICATATAKSDNKSNVKPPKAPAMCTNAPASAPRFSRCSLVALSM